MHEDLSATFSFRFSVIGAFESAHATIELYDPDGKVVLAQDQHYPVSGDTHKVVDLKAGEISLWWPNGLGDHPLYNVTLKLFSSADELLDTRTARVGFRRLRLIQRPLLDADEASRSFFF